ncbi:MAG: hypothetical protein WDN09_03380 [bacterium]
MRKIVIGFVLSLILLGILRHFDIVSYKGDYSPPRAENAPQETDSLALHSIKQNK